MKPCLPGMLSDWVNHLLSAASDHFNDAQQSTVTRMQSKDYGQQGSLQQLHAVADLAKNTPEKV